MNQTNLDELIENVLEKAKTIINLIEVGDPLIHRRGNEICIDIPLMYNGFALDRVHYNIELDMFSPKGKPCCQATSDIDVKHIKKRSEELINEIDIIRAVEFREPENAWAVPLRWRKFIIAHIKISYDGKAIVPDYALTGELRLKMMGV